MPAGAPIPTAANMPAGAPIPTAPNMSSSAPTPPLEPTDRDDLQRLLFSKLRPLKDIVADFLAKFPTERLPNIEALIWVFLQEGWLELEERLIAYALLQQSSASKKKNADFSELLNAAYDETIDKSERAFIQMLLTSANEGIQEILKQSPAHYVNESLLASMVLLPLEKLKKRAMTKEQVSRLKHLCHILGRNYEDKLSEFGAAEPDRGRVLSSVEILEASAMINFNKLKSVAVELLDEWREANTPVNKMANFYWVLVVHDTASADDIFGGGYLSTHGVQKAERELLTLKSERTNKWRSKYSSTKKKLVKLLKDSHLECGYVGFDPNLEVLEENCKQEKRRLKEIIRDVKLIIKDRKELILRVEFLKRAVKSKAAPEAIKAMLGKVMEAAENIGGGSASYDGEALKDVISLLLQVPGQDAPEQDHPVVQETAEASVSGPSETRSGKTFTIGG